MPDGRFRIRVFCVTHVEQATEYEELLAGSEEYGGAKIRLLNTSRSWTKDGDHMICVEYLELDESERRERY